MFTDTVDGRPRVICVPGKGAGPLPDQNVIVGVNADSYQAAQFVIEAFGPVQQSGIGNVPTLTVDGTGAPVILPGVRSS